MYKYLGVELVSALNFKLMKSRLVAEARKRMMLVWAMGMRRGELPVADCRRSWNALVRPVLEYGVGGCKVGGSRSGTEGDGKDDFAV